MSRRAARYGRPVRRLAAVRGAVAAAAVIAMTLAWTASAGADDVPTPVTITFTGHGTYVASLDPGGDPTNATVALSWTSTFTGTLASDGTLTPTGSGTLTSGPGTFSYSDPAYGVSCSGAAPIATGAAPPAASVAGTQLTVQSATAFDADGSSGGYASCQGTAPGSGLPFDGSGQAANLVGVIDGYLPDVLSARVTLPAKIAGPVTLPASDASAPQQLPGSCTQLFGAGSCTESLSWSGTVDVEPACGTITFSEGGALPVGTAIAFGQTLTTAAGQRMEITTPDGSIVRIGPQSQVACQAGDFAGGSGRTFKLILGDIWAKVSDALGAPGFEPPGDRAVTGVRGSEFTLTAEHDGGIAHVIEGTGYVDVKGHKEFTYPAGLGVDIRGTSVAITTSWPTAAQALVPAADRPPKLTGVSLRHAALGRGAQLRFRLDRSAAVRVQLLRGTRVLTTRTFSAQRGVTTVRPLRGHLRAGRYQLRVIATAGTRSTSATVALRA